MLTFYNVSQINWHTRSVKLFPVKDYGNEMRYYTAKNVKLPDFTVGIRVLDRNLRRTIAQMGR